MANKGLLEHQQIVVEQVRKFFELKNQYGLFSVEGERIGQIEQVEQSAFHFLARIISDLDVMLPTTLAVEDTTGAHILRLHKPWIRWTIQVSRPDGTPLGTIGKRFRLGKAQFAVTDPDGSDLATVKAENWRAKDFAVVDTQGQELARVTKQWRGLMTEAFTDADTYVVDLVVATEPMRSLALAAALSIDIVMKEKDS